VTDLEQLAGKVVLVTGASSGIGRATARLAGAHGAHVVLAARGEQTLKEAAVEAEEAGAASTLVVPTDVGDDGAVAALVEAALERHGRIDVVISNAGVVSYGRIEDVPAEVFDGVLRTNLLGAANVARHVVPVLRSQGGGSLLYVGSVIGHVAAPQMTAYTVSKWGVRALARQVRLENRDVPGLHVGYVAPGGVDTPIYQQAANYVGREGQPPPPVSSAERVARQILDRVGREHARAQLTLGNDVLRFGFTALPLVYDALVGPLLKVLAVDQGKPLAPTDGNVLESKQQLNAVSGDHGLLGGLAVNVTSFLQRARSGGAGTAATGEDGR
jgi:NAD(P)-dependent dehydrogenase (short-subunit alcohol dehydrogenase family)